MAAVVPIKHNLAVLLAFIGVVLGVVGFFVTWWEVEAHAVSRDPDFAFDRKIDLFSARPFHSSGSDDPELGGFGVFLDSAADDETKTVGWLLVGAMIGSVASLGLLVAGYWYPQLLVWMMHAPAALAVLLGLVGVVLAPLLWPGSLAAEANDLFASEGGEFREVKGEWMGKETLGESDEGEFSLDYTATAGWWITILGFVVMPLAAAGVNFSKWDLQPRVEQVPTQYLAPAASAPPPLPTGPIFKSSNAAPPRGGAKSDPYSSARTNPYGSNPYSSEVDPYAPAPPVPEVRPRPPPSTAGGPRRLQVVKPPAPSLPEPPSSPSAPTKKRPPRTRS